MENDAPSAVSRSSRPIGILAYHQTVAPPKRGTPVRSLVLSPKGFARQMRALGLLGYRGLSMCDLEPYLRGEKTGRVVGITLDDGYVNNFDAALPVLRDLGFTATSFIVSGQIGGTNAWDHSKGVPPARLMDVAHLKAWCAAGMEIGAHTRNHVNLAECTQDRAREEVAGCKQDLERVLGTEVRSFCYPYGEHRAGHAAMVREAGYATGTTVISSRTQPGDDMMLLPRLSVHLEDTLPLFLAQVATDFEDWRMAKPKMRGVPSRHSRAALYGASMS